MLISKILVRLDRSKEWEPMRSKNELAQFCPSWLPIAPNARHWEPRAAGFPAIHASSPGHPVNPVNPVQKFLSYVPAESAESASKKS
jgi:hypothetical protein